VSGMPLVRLQSRDVGVSRDQDQVGGRVVADGILAGQPGPTAGKQLTRREKEIATLVAAGLGNREIAARLFLSKRTVDSHMEHIFTKLGFSSRTQLASWVLGHGTNR